MSLAYKGLVEARCKGDPALRNLHAFLSASTASPHGEDIIFLNFFNDARGLTKTRLTPSQIRKEIDDTQNLDDAASHKNLGQILVIENISKETMADLGSYLEIDPMFFVSHIHSVWRDLEALPPKFCELPSRTKAQSFATFPYHRSFVFPEIDRQDYKLLRMSHIRRKVIVLPLIQGRRIGLAQHCCSILVVPGRKKTWLGLVLVDPPMRDTYLSFRDKQEVFIQTPCIPLFGGAQNESQMNSIYNVNGNNADNSMLEELLQSWQSDTLGLFQNSLNLKALSFYPLRLIAGEWVNYIEVIRVSLRNNSSPPSNDKASTEELDRIQSALTSSSSWPRRVASSIVSLHRTILFIKQHTQPDEDSTRWAGLRDDYEYLATSLAQHGKQLQAAVLSVTAFLQLLESRRTSSETKHVSRLTVLALTFVPLSFVSSLFSMNEAFGPGGPLFWLYFAVATPVLLIVFLVAKSSQWDFRSSFHSVKNRLILKT